MNGAPKKELRWRSEPALHGILFRWLQFKNDHKKVWGAVKKICNTREGLAAFLSHYISHVETNQIEEYELIWDANELTNLIRRDQKVLNRSGEFLKILNSAGVKKYLADSKKSARLCFSI